MIRGRQLLSSEFSLWELEVEIIEVKDASFRRQEELSEFVLLKLDIWASGGDLPYFK